MAELDGRVWKTQRVKRMGARPLPFEAGGYCRAKNNASGNAIGSLKETNMSNIPAGLVLPTGLDGVDAAFMTQVLRASGLIAATNEVVSQEEKSVGMTAGYFSAIKKVKCTYKEKTDAQDRFVVKAWPPLELAPKEVIGAMFVRDINGYLFPEHQFFPRPRAHLAAYDVENNLYALVMEDADSFAEHKVHENELRLDEVLKMIPGLVDVAVAWEGCDRGDKAAQLDALGVVHWTSEANLGVYKAGMPSGAKFVDKLSTMKGSLLGARTWDSYLGASDFGGMLTRRLDAFFATARPDNGATCTLAHGDLRGDNMFFCDDATRYPGGWLTIDFQLMFRGPVPSDLAYLMGSGSVLPEVYSGENLEIVLRSFYEQFMARTRIYRDYSFAQFRAEYATMSTIMFCYFVGFGGAIYHQGAFNNALGARIEFGGKGATEADLPPEELRQRMWWSKAYRNIGENFKTFDQYRHIAALPENLTGLGAWVDLPDHLR